MPRPVTTMPRSATAMPRPGTTWIHDRASRRRSEGFALPVVIFALVLLGVIGGAALRTSRDELLSAEAVNSSSQAFYAAEAGIHSALSNWDQLAMDTLIPLPGDSLVESWMTIENRCSYQLVYRRIDGGDVPEQLYSVESIGRSPGLNRGRRRIGVVVRSRIGIGAALMFGGDVALSGNPTILGECPDIHTNGDLDISGTTTIATVSDNVTASGTAFVGGTLQDTLGNAVTPTSSAPQQPIPDLDPTDYCGEADYIFTGTLAIEVATMTTRDLALGTWWGWKWSGGTYTTDNDNVASGVYCMDNDVEISNQLGSPSTPLAITILTTKSVTIPGDPYMVPAHPDSILIVADGDLKLNGNPAGGDQNYEGLAYAGSQCEVSGTPVMFGQLVCRNDPNPVGSEDWVDENNVSGDLRLTYNCGGMLGGGGVRPINGRTWSHVW